MKNKILLTGATSFLGKNLLVKLKERDEDIFATASHENIEQNIIKMDLVRLDETKKVVKLINPSIVYHLAALVNLSREYNVAQQCIEINIKGTLNLLESFRITKPRIMVFISTEEVYGSGPIPYIEEQPLDPPSGYAISKIAGESLCRIYARELGFKLIILRVGTMYGPGDKDNRLIPQLIMKALKNEEIPVNTGMKKRDYVFIEDVVKSLTKVLDIKNIDTHTVINIGGGISYTLLDLVNIILEETQSNSNVARGKIPERIGEASEWLMNIGKANYILGWKPTVSLKVGLRKTIDYFRKKVQ